MFLHKQKGGCVFESALLAAECRIDTAILSDVINNLLPLELITEKKLEINELIALLILTHELNYKGAYTLQAVHREKPYL